MAKPRIELTDNWDKTVLITKTLTNDELIQHAKERPVNIKDKDHETIPTTNHIQLILDNLKKGGGNRKDLAPTLLASGYDRTVVKKIMATIDMYDW